VGEFVQHEPCPECGSSDALARYDDNSAHCFACKANFKGDGQQVEQTTTQPRDWTPVEGHVQALPNRGLKEETLKFAGFKVGKLGGKSVHIHESRDDKGQLVAQKFRDKDKKFSWIGDAKNPPLYLKWKWKPGGKFLTITEGEPDAHSYLQAFDNKYPVVSLPNGTGSVEQVIKRDYEFITSFDNIVLSFDMDEPGQKALKIACEMLPPGKVKVVKLQHKDANDVLKADGPGALVKAFWSAETYRPDGIVTGADIKLEDLMQDTCAGYELPFPKLNEMMYGLRKGEITLLTAGSGIGKSTLLRQVVFGLHQQHSITAGNIYLEESNRKTAQGYIALDNSVPLGRLRRNKNILTPEQWRVSHERVIRQRMVFYNHFGSLESDRLLSKMEYMARVCGADFIAFDHISIATSGLESSSEGERKDIDILMTRLRQLVESTGVGVLGVVHLKRSVGKNFNEGGQISLNDLRGSASLEQISDNVIALERNQQADGPERDLMHLRVLKCRESGDTGEADDLIYNRETGKLELASPFDAAQSESPFDPHATTGDEIPF
jgi:twinkle protein